VKKGDWIKYNGEEDAKRLLRDLGEAGYHAVNDGRFIVITGVPEEEDEGC